MLCLRLFLLVTSLLLVVNGQQDLPNSQRNFADELTANLYQDNTNECTSSLGISMAFSLVYPSMINESKEQVEEVFGFSTDSSNLVWDTTQNSLNTLYDGSCVTGASETSCIQEQPLISISNSIWVDSGNGQTVNMTYEQLVRDLLFSIDFSASDAGTNVNSWVDTATNGLIDSIVDDGPLVPYVLVAINAIYLKANWLTPFGESRTNQDVFYASDGVSVVRQDAYFMHDVEYYQYSHEAVPGFQIIQVPFTADTLSMIFVLPAGSAKIDSTTVINALTELESTRVALALPKFQFTSEYGENLENSLISMGVVDPFRTGLCIYEDDCSTYIDVVLQKTYISLDEKGVEAAAVSAVAGITSFPTDQPVRMHLDRPFQFFIYDSSSDLMIFEGRVVDPIPSDDPTRVQVTARHEDSDFWMSQFFVEPLVVELEEQLTAMPSIAPMTTSTTQPTNTSTVMPSSMNQTIEPSAQPTTAMPGTTKTPTIAPTSAPSILPTSMNQTTEPSAQPATVAPGTTNTPTIAPTPAPSTLPLTTSSESLKTSNASSLNLLSISAIAPFLVVLISMVQF